MITIHTLREATKVGQQKRKEEARAKAREWIETALLPELLEVANEGEFKHCVVFPRSLEATAIADVLRNMGFQCEGLDEDNLRYDNDKHDCYQAVVRWM
jgi:hypothetical protein